MKKTFLGLSIIVLLFSIFCIAVCAASQEVEWGAQELDGAPKYTVDHETGATTVYHNFENVGYTYINAQCSDPTASFTTRMDKRNAIGIWDPKLTATGTINSTVEYGLGGNYGNGTYRFYLTPKNSNGDSEGVYIYIHQFFSKSST